MENASTEIPNNQNSFESWREKKWKYNKIPS